MASRKCSQEARDPAEEDSGNLLEGPYGEFGQVLPRTLLDPDWAPGGTEVPVTLTAHVPRGNRNVGPRYQ